MDETPRSASTKSNFTAGGSLIQIGKIRSPYRQNIGTVAQRLSLAQVFSRLHGVHVGGIEVPLPPNCSSIFEVCPP